MKKKAFTLVELVVVMAIISLLATLILSAIQIAKRTAIETTHRSNAQHIRNSFERLYSLYRHYPSNTAAGDSGPHVNDISSFDCACVLDALGIKLTNTHQCYDSAGNEKKMKVGGGYVGVGGGGYVEMLPKGSTTHSGYILHIADYTCTGELEAITNSIY
jgi:prepilin-type N-terminal cleavage/methylation domain-containing protein